MVKHYSPCGCSECSPKDENKHHENQVVFSCGNGMGANIPVYNQLAGWEPELVVGTVTLDTNDLKRPGVKIDFSSVVAFKTTGFLFEIAITFQLSRACNGGPKVPLTTFTYEREVGLGVMVSRESPIMDGVFVEFKDPIAFTWCECHECPGCCTYFVEVVDVDSIDIDFAVVGNVGINALAVGSK